MSYTDLLDDEGINSQFLVVLMPRRKLGTFTLFSGSVYEIDFSLGHLTNLVIDGTALTAGTSTSLSAGQFYYDFENEVLYVRTSDSSTPNDNFVVATYEMYFGTFDAHHFRVPTDSSTRAVYFEPMVVRSPILRASSTDNFYGFLPVESSSITLSNATHLFEEHISESSFYRAGVKVYHWLDELSAANMKLVFSGISTQISYNDNQINITALDRVDSFNEEFRQFNNATSFYGMTDFPNLDPNFQARPIRQVYGVVDGFVPVNIDYVQESPTTSDNRDWVLISGQSNLGSISRTVSATPSTTTRTYVNNAQGFRNRDSVWLDRVVGTDDFVIVTAVNYLTGYIEHDAIATPMASGDSAKRSFVGAVTIQQNNLLYSALYGRDYIESTSFAAGTSGFSFTTTLEANLSMGATLSPNDKVSCRVYGKKDNVTLGGPSFGADDAETGTLTHPIVILFDLLKSGLRLTEAQLDTATFASLEASLMDAVGFAIPSESRKDFPTYKAIIGDILETLLLRIFIDNDDLWTISQIAPLGTLIKSVDDTEIGRGSIQYQFDYSDICSDIVIEYGQREISDRVNGASPSVFTLSSSSDQAKYLHGINRQKTFHSLHFREADAQVLSDRLSFIFGERRGILSFNVKNRFFDSLLNDRIDVSRFALPGFAFDETIERTLQTAVVEVNRSLKAVTLVLDDQKGIEDNSGSW